MPPRSAGDMRMITLKAAADAGTTAEVTIPVQGGAGVNLGAIGWALGVEPSTVKLNGYFVSRGPDFVSSLPWLSLLSFFAARGLPAGASRIDSILVQGKPIDQPGWCSSLDAEYVGHSGFKRKATINNERPHKKNQLFDGCSKDLNVCSGQVTDDEFLSIKRRLRLVDDRPSKKGKVSECNLDGHSSTMKNAAHLFTKREGTTTEDQKLKKENILLGYSSTEQNFLAEQENINDFFCMKRRLKLDDDYPCKKGKIDEHNPGICKLELGKSAAPSIFSQIMPSPRPQCTGNSILFENLKLSM